MQEDLIPLAFRRQAGLWRILLFVVIGLTALVIVIAQWVDLAALRRISPGPVGRVLQSDNADWVDWWVECFAGPATLFAMSRIARMLRWLAEGQVFTSMVIADIRSFAFWIMIATLASLLAPVIIAPIVANVWHMEVVRAGQVSGSDLMLLLVSAIFFQVARLLDAARRMADEYRQIV